MQTESNLTEHDPQPGFLGIQWGFRGAIALFALIDCWINRFKMDPDGVSCLDMGDRYWRGDWHNALNAYWPPLYGWLTGLIFRLTKPSMRWEYPEVHLLNFAIFVAALISFEFFWRGLLESRADNACIGASRLYAWALGYLLFAHMYFGCAFKRSLGGDELTIVNPDLLVAALAFVVLGMVTQFSAGRLSVVSSCLIGILLGVAYLTKTAMLPFGACVLATMLAVSWNRRAGIRHTGLALLCFLAISTAFVAALSWNNHRFTYGDAGKLNIAWYVNGAWPRHIHWQGQEAVPAHPQHPTRKIMNWPEVYEFATPVPGTYPPWYDPTYWNAGVDTRIDPAREVFRFKQNMIDLALYLIGPAGILTAVVLTVFFLGDRTGGSWRQFMKFLPILAPAIALLLMYGMITWEPRYISWIILAGFCTLIASTSISPEDRRLSALRAASLALGAILAGVLFQNLNNSRWESGTWAQYVEAAEQLRVMGFEPGNPVAVIGDGMTEEFWARLDRVQIVAEVPRALETGNSEDAFWTSAPEGQRTVLNALKSTGASAAVADTPPKVLPPGWVAVGKTGQAVYFFR
jgi:hypothetical protein